MRKSLYIVSFKVIPDKQIMIGRGVITVIATQCTVTQKKYKKEPVIVGRGYAYCSPLDMFDFEIGRKIAMKRAISWNFTRELRTKIWKAAFEGTFYLSG